MAIHHYSSFAALPIDSSNAGWANGDIVAIPEVDYVVDTSAAVVTAHADIIPRGAISPLHFRAVGDGVTNDDTEVKEALDYAATLSASYGPWHADIVSVTGPKIVVDGGGLNYKIQTTLTMALHRNVRVQNMSLIAQGTWLADTYMIIASDSGYVTFDNVNLNCNNKTGGIKLGARARLLNSRIEKVKYVGVECAGSDAWVDQCIIGQWTTTDEEYYTSSRYTGIGVWTTESDARITNCTIRWLDVLVQLDSSNNIFASCHMFNGMKGYMNEYRNASVRSVVGTGNKTPRNNHIGVQVGYPGSAGDPWDLSGLSGSALTAVEDEMKGARFWDNTFDDVYFDNCHHELYVDGVSFNNCKFGAKYNSSLRSESASPPSPGQTEGGLTPSRTWWIRCYAYWNDIDGTHVAPKSKLQVNNFEVYVETAIRHIVNFKQHSYNGATRYWDHDTSDFNEDETFNLSKSETGAASLAHGFTLRPGYTHAYSGDDPAVVYRAMGDTGRGAVFMDDNTDVSDLDALPSVGSSGDNPTLSGGGGTTPIVSVKDPLRLPRIATASAQAASNRRGTIFYDIDLDTPVCSDGTDWVPIALAPTVPAFEEGNASSCVIRDAAAGTAATGGNNYLRYQRVGNWVNLSGLLRKQVTTGLTSGSAVFVTDIPFGVKNGSLNHYQGTAYVIGNTNPLLAVMNDNADYVKFRKYDGTYLKVSELTSANLYLYFSVRYETDDA